MGEGDCDGPLDGGPNDGHDGCQGDLVCGSNNCRKFGSYYHPKVSLEGGKPKISRDSDMNLRAMKQFRDMDSFFCINIVQSVKS